MNKQVLPSGYILGSFCYLNSFFYNNFIFYVAYLSSKWKILVWWLLQFYKRNYSKWHMCLRFSIKLHIDAIGNCVIFEGLV